MGWSGFTQAVGRGGSLCTVNGPPPRTRPAKITAQTTPTVWLATYRDLAVSDDKFRVADHPPGTAGSHIRALGV